MMAGDLTQGLYITVIAIGLVFTATATFFLILVALRWIFPTPDQDEGNFGNNPQLISDDQNSEHEEPDVRATEAEHPQSTSANQGLGPKIAAAAAAIYLEMNGQEHQYQNRADHGRNIQTMHKSSWGNIGRSLLMDTQGSRPQAAGTNRTQQNILGTRIRK